MSHLGIRIGIKSVLTFLLCTIVFPVAALFPQQARIRQIDALFSDIRSDTEPGAAVLVLNNGRIIFQRGYGVADLRTLRRIDERTNFRLASVTKQFTAMAVMLLVHDGLLSYDSRLTDVFPDFPEYGKRIRVRNLLNHTSGLPDYENLMTKPGAAAEPLAQIQDTEVLDLLKKQNATKFAPGTRWDYSNSGYVVLGTMVGKVSGKSFAEFLHERIFSPLKMDKTIAFQNGRNEVSNRAFGYSRQKGVWRQTDQSPTSATLGDGGVYSSLADLAKWNRALHDHVLLSEREMQAAFTPVKAANGSPTEPDGSPAEYGFGWFLNAYKGHRRMWHYGETVGFRTTIQRFPDDQLTVIILCNRSDVNPTVLALKIADLCMSSAALTESHRHAAECGLCKRWAALHLVRGAQPA